MRGKQNAGEKYQIATGFHLLGLLLPTRSLPGNVLITGHSELDPPPALRVHREWPADVPQ